MFCFFAACSVTNNSADFLLLGNPEIWYIIQFPRYFISLVCFWYISVGRYYWSIQTWSHPQLLFKISTKKIVSEKYLADGTFRRAREKKRHKIACCVCVSETARTEREKRNHGECFFIIKFPQLFPHLIVNEAKSKRNMKIKFPPVRLCVCERVFCLLCCVCWAREKRNSLKWIENDELKVAQSGVCVWQRERERERRFACVG